MYILGAFIEMMVILLLYNSLFNKGKMDKLLVYSLIVLVCSIVYVSYSTEDRIFAYLLLLIPEIIAIAYIDKKNINLVLMEMLISIIFGFIIQCSIIAIIFFITGKTKEYLYIHLLIYAIIIFLIIILMKHFKKVKDIDLESYIENNLLMSNVILNIFTFFMILKLIYHSEIISNMVVIEIIVLIFVNILFNISFYKNMHKKIIRNKNMEVKNAYNPLLDEIIQNIKANEHEYKNHIGMLFSMIQVSNSIPELKERAGKYIGNIQNTNILSKVLDVESTIIKSVLYSKLVECDQLGISISYEIKTNLEDSLLDDTEITIILSNLLNNAIEASKNTINKDIKVDIRKFERYKIEVKNNITGLNINPNEIEEFFKKGFSSKGNGRGYGLYNVKKIVKKHKGAIYARMVEDYLVIEIYV
ncbi:MAG: GHKL domain-containing protein [Clostridium sp.]|uniref:sensor histidine kinase n=1 Tax=Clostridium sp. TaxID=1506 RepID=UPI002A75584F|nr:ATP-binding protein [Clostridium sp.]MCI6692067.1 GHKL domain-containing protein [Clostridium sp.]MDY2631899.1 ATP-binding protein [Clostridium sp.]